jgi:hypothetical protein
MRGSSCLFHNEKKPEMKTSIITRLHCHALFAGGESVSEFESRPGSTEDDFAWFIELSVAKLK